MSSDDLKKLLAEKALAHQQAIDAEKALCCAREKIARLNKAETKMSGEAFLAQWGYSDVEFKDGTKLSSFVHLPAAKRSTAAKNAKDLVDTIRTKYDMWQSRNMLAWLFREDDDEGCLGWE